MSTLLGGKEITHISVVCRYCEEELLSSWYMDANGKLILHVPLCDECSEKNETFLDRSFEDVFEDDTGMNINDALEAVDADEDVGIF